jgi:light-regulated signal transduction histidine kinase (bacteriophytochrome)
MFWVPMYRFNAVVRLMTGIVSLFTVYHLFKVLPDLFKQRTNLELENEIALRLEAERKLEEANIGLQAFAYIASHDLQEPLRKIRTYSSLLNQANAHNYDERSKGYADKLTASAERMQALIGDVLSLSTISDEVVLEKVNTHEVIHKAIEDLELKITEKEAVINVSELPAVKGFEAYLTQLFFNLINNAIKFNINTPVVNITGKKQNDRVIIEVADNGIGMSEENYQKVFEAFQRLHSKAEYEGTGIGLAICKKIIQVHHGKISVQSKLGVGTTFYIELESA